MIVPLLGKNKKKNTTTTILMESTVYLVNYLQAMTSTTIMEATIQKNKRN
ncbi:hypothetical protein FRACYDRAFT_269830 [Fragilariopsis cylindrus CCMP1102]|uniref:Uncharacterized protein n=1 Tax=Fragilariopsis cylindrus CCMP1102 TaxID=635003 RepID=A0A1E7F6I8_9STRA|nr:hypothetical protein FRACYDRAFT_269830 [Fragilariopsis cylindrus CCMP1102]|eukprot:OEU13473.1 hypothetical protein FRACYDRAFT_269830 [Fragilariopsis cylindrus CCMP1102]